MFSEAYWKTYILSSPFISDSFLVPSFERMQSGMQVWDFSKCEEPCLVLRFTGALTFLLFDFAHDRSHATWAAQSRMICKVKAHFM